MNNEIKLPVKWIKEKGIGIHVDDGFYNQTLNLSFSITMGQLDKFNPSDKDSEYLFITSFADRENTGEQPVDDWVPVACKIPDVGD